MKLIESLVFQIIENLKFVQLCLNMNEVWIYEPVRVHANPKIHYFNLELIKAMNPSKE